MKTEYIVYLLVFAASVATAYVLYLFFTQFGRERGESLDGAARPDAGRGIAPMDRFVSPGRLFQMRIVAAAVPAVAVPLAFVMGGVSNPLLLVPMMAVFGWIGWMTPLWVFTRKVAQRKAAFESKILDLTMGLANALKAGMALPQGLEKVMQQMDGPMHEEMMTVLSEYRLGISITDALWRLQDRMPCEDLRLLTSAVRLTMQSGGSLVEVLSEMVEMIRSRTEFQEKLKTLTAQGRFEALAMASAPVAAFVLLYFCQPDLMRPLVTTTTGWIAIAVAALLEAIGFVVIRKIVTIEV